MKNEKEINVGALYRAFVIARDKHPEKFSDNSPAQKARKAYINAEVELLESLEGKNLATLNFMIEANCEYIDLALEEMFSQGFILGGKAALDIAKIG